MGVNLRLKTCGWITLLIHKTSGLVTISIILPGNGWFSCILNKTFCNPGVCGHTSGKLTHPQTKAGPLINENSSGEELVDFYDGGDHARPFSQTPKYVDKIFLKTPNMLAKFSETKLSQSQNHIIICSFKVSD